MNTIIVIRFFILLLFVVLANHPTVAQDQSGILLMAHGGSPEWNVAVNDAVQPLQKQCPLVVAFGMADKESLQKGITELENRGVKNIAVVRLFISGSSFLHQTEYVLGLRPDPPAEFVQHDGHGSALTSSSSSHHASHSNSNHGDHTSHAPNGQAVPAPIKTRAQLVLSQPGLIDAEEIAKILYERVAKLSTKPEQEWVLVLAHGMGDDRENEQVMNRMASLIRDLEMLGNFRAINVETLREDWQKNAKPQKREFAAS